MGLTYSHCYESERDGQLDSKYIGVIHNGNRVGSMMEEEIKRLTKYQAEVYSQKLRKFIKENGGLMDPTKMTESQLLKLKSLGKKPIAFEVKNFLTKQEMFDFI